MDPLDDIALLQITVLQQDLLERDVEEARKRKKKKKTQLILDPSMASRREEEAIWTLRQTYGGVRPTVFFFDYLRMKPAMFHELVQRVLPRIEKHDTKTSFRFSSNEIKMCGMLLKCCKNI